MWKMKITVSPNIVALPTAHVFTTTDTDDDKMRSAKTVVTSVISDTLCSIPGMSGMQYRLCHTNNHMVFTIVLFLIILLKYTTVNLKIIFIHLHFHFEILYTLPSIENTN